MKYSLNRARAYISFAAKVASSNFKRLGFPYKLTYAVTYKCNYRCKTCNIWKRRPDNELNLDEVRRFFRASKGFSWVDVTGGEPFLRGDIGEIFAIILEECPDLLLLHFPTNGYFTERVVQCMANLPLKSHQKIVVTVSLDGDEKENDEIRGVKGGWRRQIATFQRLSAIPHIKAYLGMTLSSSNVDRIFPTYEAVKAEIPGFSIDDFHINISHISSHYYGNENLDIIPSPEILTRQIESFMKVRGTPKTPFALLELEYLRRVSQYVKTGRTPIKCHSLKSSCFLNPEGEVFPCGMYGRKLGNIRDHEYDLSRIWESEECAKAQEEIWTGKCPQCWTPCEAYQSILGNALRAPFS